MEKLKMFVVFLHVQAISSCSYSYNYNVYPCKEDETKMGEFIVGSIRSSRDASTSIKDKPDCFKDNTAFLKRSNFLADVDPTESSEVIGTWNDLFYHMRSKIFFGPEATLKAVEENATLNIIIDKDYKHRIYKLVDGEKRYEKIATDAEIYDYVKNNQKGECLTLITDCRNILQNLAPERQGEFTITLADSSRSKLDKRFIRISNGIGGFYKSTKLMKNFPKKQAGDGFLAKFFYSA